MKVNVRKFLGIFLTILMIASIFPASLVEAGVSTSNKFKVGNSEYILMPNSTYTSGGKKYVGVLSTSYVSYTWAKAQVFLNYLTDNVSGASGVNIPVAMCIKNTDNGTVTDIQDYDSLFDAFGDSVIPDTYQWNMSGGNSSLLYFTGSVGIPRQSEYANVCAKDTLGYGSGDRIFVTSEFNWYAGGGYYYMTDASVTNGSRAGGNPNVNKNNSGSSANSAGGTWYFMTYVAKDFFLKNKVVVDKNLGGGFKSYLADNFSKEDMLAEGIYSVDELKDIGFQITDDDLKLKSIRFDQTEVEIAPNGTATLTPQLFPASAIDADLSWSSTNEGVATVENGVVTAVTTGQTVIRATSLHNPSIYAECTVKVVLYHPEKIELDKETAEISVGMDLVLTPTITPALSFNKEVTWESTNDQIAMVENGVVTAFKPGDVTITAKTVDGGKTASCRVSVKSRSVTGVELDKEEMLVFVGDTGTLKATVLPQIVDDGSVRWSSTKPSVADVVGGVVTAYAPGETVITVTTIDGGFSDSCLVTVKTKDITAIEFDTYKMSIDARATKTITATVVPSAALNQNLTWKSSDESVATVENGAVTAVAPGETVITATSEENPKIKAECVVTVNNVVGTGVTLDMTEGKGAVGEKITLKATVLPENASNINVVWSSGNEEIATVENGVVTLKKPGTVFIKAALESNPEIYGMCFLEVLSGISASPNYLKLENGVELLFNEVKEVEGETYLGFMIAKDYAGSATTAGVYFVADSVDPLGNPLDSTMYGEYMFSGNTTNTNSGIAIDTLVTEFPEAMQDKFLLNEWKAGLQYNLNATGGGTALSKTYFCLPSAAEIVNHLLYISGMINDNDGVFKNRDYATNGKVAVIREANSFSHQVYWPAESRSIEVDSGIPYICGSFFPTFYVNANAFGEVKFDLASAGADVKKAFVEYVSLNLISKAGYTKEALYDFGYVDDQFELTSPITVAEGERNISFSFVNNDVMAVDHPIVIAAAYDDNNKIVAVTHYISNTSVRSKGTATGSFSINLPATAKYVGVYAVKSAENPVLAGQPVLTKSVANYTEKTSADKIEASLIVNEGTHTADFTAVGTIAPDSDALLLVTKPGKTLADLSDSKAKDVILNIAKVSSDASGKYGYRFNESMDNLEYAQYIFGIYNATEKATTAVSYIDSGYEKVLRDDFKTLSLAEFIEKYGDMMGIDKDSFGLLTKLQQNEVKTAMSVDGKSATAIAKELNQKMKAQFIDDLKNDFKTLALPTFATQYASKLPELDTALASSLSAEQEAAVKAAVKTIDYDSTPESIAADINKEMAAQVFSKANTKAAIQAAIENYGDYIGLDLENWLDRVKDKDAVYTVLANSTFADAKDLTEAYEKAVMIARINEVTAFTEIYKILSQYADEDGALYGITLDPFKKLANTKFANSLMQKYDDWAEFESVFKKNADYYESQGGGSGGSGGGGGNKSGGTGEVRLVKGTGETTAPIEPQYMFSDLGQAKWAVSYIEALAKLGYVNGKGNNTFCPNDSIKREEIVKILVSALGLDVSATEASFTDVDANAWYAPYIAAAKAKGIVNGNSDGSFGVGAEITREELATMTYRALGLASSEANVEFADEAEISDYAKEAVKTLVAAGVLNGKGNNLFAPKANATRAEASKIIYLAVIGQ